MSPSRVIEALTVAVLVAAGCGGDEFSTPQTGGAGGGGGANAGAGGSGAAGTSGSTQAGGPPLAGSAGASGNGGSNGGCSDQPDCQACCDHTFPQTHEVFAEAFYSCACDDCAQVCRDNLCSDAYSWDAACLGCVRGEIGAGCTDAALACSGEPDCEAFAACSFSCL